MSNFYGQSTSDTSTRRTWNLDEYKKRAIEREAYDRQLTQNDERRKLGLPPKKIKDPEEDTPKALLKQREGKLNLDARRQPGFYCEACDCVLKDNISYLDHINGRKHQINMGQIMTVERSTLEQVRARLALLKRKRAQIKKFIVNLNEQIALQKQKQEEERDKRKARQQAKKQRVEEENKEREQEAVNAMGGTDNEMAAMMGFSGFSTSKK
ncbi:hypothetical protein BDF22DRAFT_742504 [Syncephalis plumigaleata]|nr:hypothetical protein BDF22DRAFT_742504 [Syncephalis plumigaleata]